MSAIEIIAIILAASWLVLIGGVVAMAIIAAGVDE